MKPSVLLLLSLLLTACTAVTPTAAPTVTALPSATPTLTVTQALVWQTPTPASGDVLPPAEPTATPLPSPTPPPTATATPTPIPTLPPEQVGGLEGVPDPRATAPGLFDLARSDAPIPQFVNAMRMGGIEVSGEEVAARMAYRPVSGVDGRPYVIGVYALDPDPAQQGETLEGPIPLVIWSEEEGWEEATPDNYGRLASILFGNVSHPPGTGAGTELFSELKKNRTSMVITVTDYWPNREKQEGVENLTYIDKQIKEAFDLQTRVIRIESLLHIAPSWLNNKSEVVVQKTALDHIDKHMEYIYQRVKQEAALRGITDEITIEFNVTNEPWHSNLFSKKFGSRNQYVLTAFQKANSKRTEILSREENKNQKIRIKLGLSHADNHYTQGEGYRQTHELLQMLANNKVFIDYLDLHCHEKDATKLPPTTSIDQAIRSYYQYITPEGKPIAVVVGEYDLNISKLSSNQRLIDQGNRYFDFILTALKAGVREFSFFGISDPESWYETDIRELEYRNPNADALLFDDEGFPKPSYYAINRAISAFLFTQQ